MTDFSDDQIESLRLAVDSLVMDRGNGPYMCEGCGTRPFPESLTDHPMDCVYAEAKAVLDGTTVDDLREEEENEKIERLLCMTSHPQKELLWEIMDHWSGDGATRLWAHLKEKMALSSNG